MMFARIGWPILYRMRPGCGRENTNRGNRKKNPFTWVVFQFEFNIKFHIVIQRWCFLKKLYLLETWFIGTNQYRKLCIIQQNMFLFFWLILCVYAYAIRIPDFIFLHLKHKANYLRNSLIKICATNDLILFFTQHIY